MKTTFLVIGLREYRQGYPGSALNPTITQSGVLRGVLERQQCKTARRTRRRAARRRAAAITRAAFLTLWRAVTSGFVRWSEAEGPTQTAERSAALNS